MADNSARISWRSEIHTAWPYATSAVSLLFFIALFVGVVVTWQSGSIHIISFATAVADPALAAILMIAVCLISPAVFSGKQYQVAHAFSLPTLYMAILFGLKLVGRGSASALQQIEGIQRLDSMWLNIRIVSIVWVGMVLIFLVVRILKQTPKADTP